MPYGKKKFTEKKETITSGIEKLTLSVYQKRSPCPFAIRVCRMSSNICRNNMNCTLISGRQIIPLKGSYKRGCLFLLEQEAGLSKHPVRQNMSSVKFPTTVN